MRTLIVALLCGLLAVPVLAQQQVEIDKLQAIAQQALQDQQWDKAAVVLQALTAAEPKNGEHWLMLGIALHSAGKLDEALPIHCKAAEFPVAAAAATYNIACVHALKGDKDKAFEFLNLALERGFADANTLANDKDIESLRSDARFKPIAEKVKAKAGRGGMPVFAPQTRRISQRVAAFGPDGVPQLSLDYGPVPWNDKYDAVVGSEKFRGKKWRLGSDFWTSLDTSMPLTIGGVSIPVGYYYLTLTQLTDNLVLGVHDAAEVKKQRLDAVLAAQSLQGGLEVPLQYEKGTDKADRLQIAIDIDPASGGKSGTLVIRFGPHSAKAKVEFGFGG
jgi:tetratricopeptide (TPR) repeat protein